MLGNVKSSTIQKTKIMASYPITSWQIAGETTETVKDCFLGPQNHCRWWLHSWNLKRRLLLGRKAVTNLDSILKSRDITLLTKVCLVKALVFLIVIYGCEIWVIMKTEHWRIYAFELWCWRRLLRESLEQQGDPTNNPKGNQSWIFIGRTDAEAETPILWSPDAKN